MKINKMISKAMAAAVAATMLIGSSAVMADELDSNFSKSDHNGLNHWVAAFCLNPYFKTRFQ